MEKNADYCGYLEESGLRYVENEFLKQTLTEIKEIAKSYNHYSAHAPVSGYSDILQKISEVKDE